MKTLLLALAVLGGGYYYYTTLPTAPVHRLAPEGTYYLLSAYPADSPGQSPLWVPGQLLRVNPHAPVTINAVTLTDGVQTMPVPNYLLTQDLDEAAAAQRAETTRAANVARSTRLGNGSFHATALDQPATRHGFGTVVSTAGAPVVYGTGGSTTSLNRTTSGQAANPLSRPAQSTMRAQPSPSSNTLVSPNPLQQ